MMEQTLKLEDGTTLEIYQDNDCSPREWDNSCTLIFFGSHSGCGDNHNFNSNDAEGWDEMEKLIKRELNVKHIQKVYGYSHGGLAVSLEPYSCRWDSGVLGFAVVTAKNVTTTQGGKNATKKRVQQCIDNISGELETLNQALIGDVYGFTLEDEEGEHMDSCGGFYGSNIEENGMLDYISEDYHKEIINNI